MPARRRARSVFARNVRAARAAKGWSQEALAAHSGLHRTFIGSVERSERNVSIDSMEKIATALGVELHSLLREPD